MGGRQGLESGAIRELPGTSSLGLEINKGPVKVPASLLRRSPKPLQDTVRGHCEESWCRGVKVDNVSSPVAAAAVGGGKKRPSGSSFNINVGRATHNGRDQRGIGLGVGRRAQKKKRRKEKKQETNCGHSRRTASNGGRICPPPPQHPRRFGVGFIKHFYWRGAATGSLRAAGHIDLKPPQLLIKAPPPTPRLPTRCLPRNLQGEQLSFMLQVMRKKQQKQKRENRRLKIRKGVCLLDFGLEPHTLGLGLTEDGLFSSVSY